VSIFRFFPLTFFCLLIVLYYYLIVCLRFQGNKIHAAVIRTLIYKFGKDLLEGNVYSMSNFGVAANLGSY